MKQDVRQSLRGPGLVSFSGTGGTVAERPAVSVEELLIWTYRDQRADWLLGRGAALFEGERAVDGLAWQGMSGDGCAAVARIAELGVRVDTSGPARGLRAEVHADAEAVHELVMALPDRVAAGLAIQCARTGGRPDWRPGARWRFEPVEWVVRDGERRGRVDMMAAGGRGGRVAYVPVREVDGLAETDYHRDLYRRWWGVLSILASTLRRHPGCLGRHAAMETLPPERPWEDPDQVFLALAGAVNG